MRVDHMEEQSDKAFRLLEALSDIDEELLARSEQTMVRSAARVRSGSNAIPLWKYGSVVAACFILLVLGTGAYGFGRLVFGGESTGGTVDLASIAQGINDAGTVGHPENAYETTSVSDEGMRGEQEDTRGRVPGITEDLELELAQEENARTESARDHLSEDVDKLSDTQSQLSQSVTSAPEGAADLTLAAAKGLSVAGAYVPETMPEGYQFASATAWAVPESYHALSLTYVSEADSGHIELKITDYYMLSDDFADGNVYDLPMNMMLFHNVIPADQVTEETFRTGSEVAVLYDGEMIVQFTGNVDAGTFYQVFASVRP